MAHYPIIRRRWMSNYPRMPLKHQLVVLTFTQMYLLFLNVPLVYGPYPILSNLITISTYLLLICLLSDSYVILFSREIMLFLLISRMLIYIFLLLSSTNFMFSLATHTLSGGSFFSFVLPIASRVFTSLTKSIPFFCLLKYFCVIIYLDDILVLTQPKHANKRPWTFLCSPLVHLGLFINFSKSEFWHIQQFSFS